MTDLTYEELTACLSTLNKLVYAQNLGSTVRARFEYARNDLVYLLSNDGQVQLREILL